MSEPVQWGKANLRWTREGYVLTVPLWADARAAQEAEEPIRRAVAQTLEAHAPISIRIEEMEVSRTETSTSADPGEIEILMPTMMNPVEAEELRKALSWAVESSIAEAERAKAVDEAEAKAVLAVLRQSSG